jgi:hypothetical protein
VFFSINRLATVLAGQLTIVVALKAALTYVVPFSTSNYGILAASRRPSNLQEVPQPSDAATHGLYAMTQTSEYGSRNGGHLSEALHPSAI